MENLDLTYFEKVSQRYIKKYDNNDSVTIKNNELIDFNYSFISVVSADHDVVDKELFDKLKKKIEERLKIEDKESEYFINDFSMSAGKFGFKITAYLFVKDKEK